METKIQNEQIWREDDFTPEVAEAVNQWSHDSDYELKITEACAESEWRNNRWKEEDDDGNEIAK